MRWLLIFIALLFFLTACSSESPEQKTQKTFVHVVPVYRESVVAYEEFALPVQQLSPAYRMPQTASRRSLADAGDQCDGPGDCLGFCLAYRRNATQGFCSDTRTPDGCWEYMLERNVTRIMCS